MRGVFVFNFTVLGSGVVSKTVWFPLSTFSNATLLLECIIQIR